MRTASLSAWILKAVVLLLCVLCGLVGRADGDASQSAGISNVDETAATPPQAPAYVQPAHHRAGIDPALCDLQLLSDQGRPWQEVAAHHSIMVDDAAERVLVQADANLMTNTHEGNSRLREPFHFPANLQALLAAQFPEVEYVEMGVDTRFRAWVAPGEISNFHTFLATLQPETVVFPWHPEAASYGTVNSEGPGAMGVSGYPSPSPTGAGVKVAIFDNGFVGVNTTAASEVGAYTSPQANVHTGTEVHGTACAEIVRDAAPASDLRLYALPLGLSYVQATQDAIAWGADVISVSLGGHGYPGEGDGPDAARLAHQNGILWCNSAGNYGYRKYWEKQTPVVTSSYVEQSPGITLNQLNTTGASRIWVSYTNEQPTGSYARFQVQIFADSGGGPTVVAQGTAGSTLQSVIYNGIQAGTTYYVGIRQTQTGTIGKMRFFLFDGGTLTKYSNQGSISNPACLDVEVLTVGAVNYSNYNASGSPTTYSSRGGGIFNMPLDFCAPTACSTVTYGASAFHGTSCSCPNAAGLMALQISHPSFQSDPVGTATLVNLGAAGWDVDSGWGILKAPTQTGGGGVVLYQNQPVALAGTPSNLTITPQSYFWNAVAITSAASSNWDLQMSTVTSTSMAGVCDFLVADGNAGVVVNNGVATRASGATGATVEHAGLTSMLPGGLEVFDFSGGHCIHLWEVDVSTPGNFPITISGSSSTNFRWYVFGPGASSNWKGASAATYGPFAVSGTPQNLNLSTQGYWVIVLVLDNGATSTDSILVEVGNPVTVPSIYVSAPTLNLGVTSSGVAGATTSYLVSGTNLTDDIDINAPLNVELSLTGQAGTWTPHLVLPEYVGDVALSQVYARIAASAPGGAVSGNIAHTSPGAYTVNTSLSGTVTAPATPTIVVSQTTLDLGATTQGSVGQAFGYTVNGTNLTADITVAAPTDIEVSLSSSGGFGASVVLARAGSTVPTTWVYARIASSHPSGSVGGSITHSSGATNKTLSLTGTVVVAGSGAIIVSHSSIDLETTIPGLWSNGTEFHYDVQGTGLVGNVVVTAPAHVEIRTAASTIHASSKTLVPSGGVLPLTRIYVRMQAGSSYVGPVSGDITHASTGAATALVSVTGDSVPSNASAIMLYIASTGFSPIPMGTHAYGVSSSTAAFTMYYRNISGVLHIDLPPGIQGKKTNGPWLPELEFSGSTSGNEYVSIRVAPDALPGIVSGEILVTAAGSPRGRILVEGTVTAPSGAAIGLSVESLALQTADQHAPSTPMSYSLSAVMLSGDLTITAPADVEISATGNIGSFGASVMLSPVAGVIQNKVLYVRISPLATASGTSNKAIAGNVSHSGGGATTALLSVAGTLRYASGAGIVLSTQTLNLGTSEAGQVGTQLSYTVATTSNTYPDAIQIIASPEIELSYGTFWRDNLTISASGATIYVRARATLPDGLINATIRHHQLYCEDKIIAVTGDVAAASTPTVLLEPPGYDHALSSIEGSVSSPAVYGVRGYSLSADLLISPPSGFEVSTDNVTYSGSAAITPNAGAVPLTAVYVRIAASASAGLLSGVVGHSSAGANSLPVNITGRVFATSTPAVFCDASHIQLPTTIVSTYGTGVPFTVSGINCTSRIEVSRSSNSLEVSTDGLNWTSTVLTPLPVTGAVQPTVIYIRKTQFNSILGLQSPGFVSIKHVGSTTTLNVYATCFGDAAYSSAYTVTAPNGGESWQAGTSQTILWNHDAGYHGGVAIELSNDGGNTWFHLIASHLPGTQGSYTWAIPSNTPAGTSYRIRIRRTLAPMHDLSDADFTITAAAAPAVQVTQAGLNLGNTTVGTPGTPVAYDVDGSNLGTIPITITPPAGVEIRNATAGGTFSSNAILLLPSGGVVPSTGIEVRIAAGAQVGQSFNDLIQVSGTGSTAIALTGTVNPPAPGIALAPGSLNLGTVTVGSAGTPQGWLVTGSNLTQDVTVTPPAGVEIRNTSGGAFTTSPLFLTQVAGAVSATLEARIAAGATTGQTFGDITHVSGAASNNVTLTGTVLPLPSLGATPASLNLGTSITGTAGTTVDSYNLTGSNLVLDVTITPPAGIQIRDAAGGTFATTPLVIVPSGGGVNVTIEARIGPSALPGSGFGPITNVSGGASQDVTISATVLPQPQLAANPTTIDLGSVVVGGAGTIVDFYTLSGSNLLANVSITPPADIEIRDASGGSFANTPLTIVPTAGSVNVTIEARIAATATIGQSFGSIANASGTQNVGVSIIGSVTPPAPVIDLVPGSLNLGSTQAGTPGAAFTYTVSGTNLTGDLTITPPAGVEIRQLPAGTFDTIPIVLSQTAGSLAATDFEVRIAAAATAGQSFGPIVHNEGTVTSGLILTGTVTGTGGSGGGGGGDDGSCSTTQSTSLAALLILLISVTVLLTRAARRQI